MVIIYQGKGGSNIQVVPSFPIGRIKNTEDRVSALEQQTSIILISENGTHWQIGITNSGELTATSL